MNKCIAAYYETVQVLERQRRVCCDMKRKTLIMRREKRKKGGAQCPSVKWLEKAVKAFSHLCSLGSGRKTGKFYIYIYVFIYIGIYVYVYICISG